MDIISYTKAKKADDKASEALSKIENGKGGGDDSGTVYFSPGDLTGYYIPSESNSYDDFDYNTTTLNDYYSLLDNVISKQPNYADKIFLGMDQSNQYEINRYTLTSIEPLYERVRVKKKPKIIIICGAHGGEKASIFSLYYFIKDLCENWRFDPILEYMRHNVDFVIIPIANPYSFVNNTRGNSRGVDINRNFPDGWSIDGGAWGTSSGTDPFSEVESRYIRDLILSNKDAIYLCDYHTNNSTGDSYHNLMWFPESYYHEGLLAASKQIIKKQTNEFIKRYNQPDDEEDWFGYTTGGTPTGQIRFYSSSQSIPSNTTECFRKFPNDEEYYNPLAVKACTEFIGNWLGTVLKQLKKEH